MFEPSEQLARKRLREVCRLTYSQGYLKGTEGNLSLRLTNNRLLSTPSNTCKGLIKEDDLILTDLNGNLLSEVVTEDKRPSTELKMHLLAYSMRPDAGAIVHAHPTVTVGFTVAGKSLSKPVLPEIVCNLGSIPVAPYATPSTDEVPESIRPFVSEYDAIVLDHHGALTIGKDIYEAFYKLEMLEHFAETIFVAELLGGAVSLQPEQIEKLLKVRSVYGLTKPVRVQLQ